MKSSDTATRQFVFPFAGSGAAAETISQHFTTMQPAMEPHLLPAAAHPSPHLLTKAGL